MIFKRSQSPLRIDSITLDHCNGVIGMTICPGRKASHFMGVDWERDLDLDLGAISDWGASVLVSLMEEEEMAWYGAADLPQKAIELGLIHYHLPIVDFDIPDEAFEEQWQVAGKKLRHHLLSGESIVIHCLGGLGRTGTIVGRLLVEFGSDPDTAIRQIRAARPGAIQTIMQETYVRRCRSVSE